MYIKTHALMIYYMLYCINLFIDNLEFSQIIHVYKPMHTRIIKCCKDLLFLFV